MELKYFSHTDNKETLRAKYRELAKKWHPDRNIGKEAYATKIMQDINSELEYCLKFGNTFNDHDRNFNELNNLIIDFLITTLDEIISDEKNISIRIFFKEMRDSLQRKPLLAIDFLNIMNNVYKMRGMEPPRKFYTYGKTKT